MNLKERLHNLRNKMSRKTVSTKKEQKSKIKI